MIFSRRKYLKNRDGATAIEASLCLPIVMMLIYACIQYGIFFYQSSEIHRNMDVNMRKATIMSLPSKSQIEGLIASKIPQQLQSQVEYTVTFVEQFDETFAKVNLTYTRSMHIPFLDNFELTSEYNNFLLLSELEDSA